MFRHYLGPTLHLGVLRTRWERDLMSLLMKVKDVEYPSMIAATREALGAITDRDRDKTVSTLPVPGGELYLPHPAFA